MHWDEDAMNVAADVLKRREIQCGQGHKEWGIDKNLAVAPVLGPGSPNVRMGPFHAWVVLTCQACGEVKLFRAESLV